MHKKRIEYLAVTWTLFIVSFVVFGVLVVITDQDMQSTHISMTTIIGFGLLGGYGFSSVLSGCIIFARYITKKTLGFKILCNVLFVITFGTIVFIGVFSFIPYSIYNIHKIIGKDELP